jgi:PhnB protein
MTVKPVPEGYQTVSPYLIVDDAKAQLEFVHRAFGARVVGVHYDSNGRFMHGDVVIGDSHVMLGEATAEWKAMPAMIHLYVPDCDAAFRSAMAAGATSVREPKTEFYGDRSGGVRDKNGNVWWVATHVEDVSSEEMERRMKGAASAQKTAV